MELTIKYFGMAAEATHKSEEKLQPPSAITVQSLLQQLANRYPELKAMELRVAVNQSIANPETEIKEDAEVALLPPFAGG